MTGIVEVEGLHRRFGDVPALQAVDFRAEEGKVHGLLGVNGAGKTTLIRHLLGLLRAESGSVRVFGLDPVRDSVAVLSDIGYLSEHRDLPGWMRIGQLLRYTQAYYPAWDDDYARELLESFRLDPESRISELSMGMRAQAGLVVAVAHRPRLLILDEPSSGLDVVVREDILDAIVRTVRDDGRTVIFSSHLIDEVERMSDHITMLGGGRVLVDQPLQMLAEGHLVSELEFSASQAVAPQLSSVLAMDGEGTRWQALHSAETAMVAAEAAALGGSLISTRVASLKEVFLARAGRDRYGELSAP